MNKKITKKDNISPIEIVNQKMLELLKPKDEDNEASKIHYEYLLKQKPKKYYKGYEITEYNLETILKDMNGEETSLYSGYSSKNQYGINKKKYIED